MKKYGGFGMKKNKANLSHSEQSQLISVQRSADWVKMRKTNLKKQSQFANITPETCVIEQKTTIHRKNTPDFTAKKSSFLYNILLKRNQNDSSDMIYLSSISVVLSPKNVAYSFNPLAAWSNFCLVVHFIYIN